MTLEKFTSIVERLKAIDSDIVKLYTMKVDLMDFVDPLQSIISNLIEEVYGEEGQDWFSWFCYENHFGERFKEEGPRAWDKDKNPIMYDIESLWTYLEELKNK